MLRQISLLTLILLPTTFAQAQTFKSDYLRYIKIAADRGWQDYPRSIEDWKKKPTLYD